MILELLLTSALGATAWLAGRFTGRATETCWWAVFFSTMACTSLVIVGNRSPRMSFVFPFSWAVDARVEPFLMAAIVPLLLSVLSARLKHRPQRAAVSVFMSAMFIYFAWLPFLMPAIVHADLLGGRTHIDARGICLQTHSYTCGPAAAVTCLRHLHIDAEESTLAVRARTAPVFGTEGQRLARTMNEMYFSRGIVCDYRFVPSLDALVTPAIAAISLPRIGGHYVAVLEITPDEVIVGDPLSGRERYSREEFLGEWTGAALEFFRRKTQ